MNSSVIGSELLLKVHDMEPIYLGEITSKSHGRVTVDFNKGIRVFLQMNRTTAPSKLPVILIAVSDGIQYAGGVNAIELFQESIKIKQPSSIAREHSKLISSFARDGALVSYKLRISVEKVPIATKEKTAPVVNHRATDILRTNEQYRQICRDLSAQVSALEAKVDRMTAKKKNPSQVQYQRTTTTGTQMQDNYGYSGYGGNSRRVTFQEQTTGARSRPSLDFKFDDDDKPRRKRNNRSDSSSMSSSLGGPSIQSSSENFSINESDNLIDDSLDINSSSDYRKSKNKKKNKKSNYSSVPSIGYSSVVDESFSDDDDLPKKKSKKKNKKSNYSSVSVDDVDDLDSDKDLDSVSDVESIDDYSDKPKSKSKKNKKKDYSSIEEIDDLSSDKPKSKSKSKSNAKKPAKDYSSVSDVDDFHSSSDMKKKTSSSSSPIADSVDSFESDDKPKSNPQKSKPKSYSSSSNLSDFESSNSDTPKKKVTKEPSSPDFVSDSFEQNTQPKKDDPFASLTSNESF